MPTVAIESFGEKKPIKLSNAPLLTLVRYTNRYEASGSTKIYYYRFNGHFHLRIDEFGVRFEKEPANHEVEVQETDDIVTVKF